MIQPCMQHKVKKKDWAWEREKVRKGESDSLRKKEENRLPLLPLSEEKVTFNLKVETFISICRDHSSSRLADAGALCACVCVCVCVRVCVRACVRAATAAAWGSSVLGLHDRQTGRHQIGTWMRACLFLDICVFMHLQSSNRCSNYRDEGSSRSRL